jgi:hypothetical protein
MAVPGCHFALGVFCVRDESFRCLGDAQPLAWDVVAWLAWPEYIWPRFFKIRVHLNVLFEHVSEAVVMRFFYVHHDAIGKPIDNVKSTFWNMKLVMGMYGLVIAFSFKGRDAKMRIAVSL